jgi:hypothetical protein
MVSYKCLITRGEDEELVDVVERDDGKLDRGGEIMPTILLQHSTGQYLLTRRWAKGIFVYKPVETMDIE